MSSENNALMKLNNAEVVLNEQQLHDLEDLSAMCWELKKIARYFGIAYEIFKEAYENSDPETPGSIKFHFDRGLVKSSAKVDLKLVRSVEAGNLTAIQIYEKKIKERELEKFKEELLNGHR